MATHELKTWPDMFRAVVDGRKCFEARVNDRRFDVGDVLVLKEYDPGPWNETKYMGDRGYTNREHRCVVTYIVHGGQFGIERGHCIMSIAPLKESP